MTVPVLFADDPRAEVPEHMAHGIAEMCPSGWAVLEYKGHDNVNETFDAECGSSN